jgi:hypothetical protein
MRQELEVVYPFVKKWMKEKCCDYEMPTKSGEVIWSNDYTEYRLYLNFFSMPQLTAENIEMASVVIFDVPVPPTEERFKALMGALTQ